MPEPTVPNVPNTEPTTQDSAQTNEPKVEPKEKTTVGTPVVSDNVRKDGKDDTGVSAQVEKAAKKFKLKVDGITEEVDEETLIKMAQLSKASQERFNKAAEMKKEAAQFFKMLKDNPIEVLQHPNIGVDVKKFAEEYLIKEMEKAELSPEARRAYEAEQKVAQYEKEKEETAKQAEEAKQVELQEQWSAKYEEDIKDALEKTSIPKTIQSVKRMVMYMLDAIEHKVDLTPMQAAQQVRNDYMGDTKTMYSQLDGETLLQILGEDVATKIRKTDLARLETKIKAKSQPDGEAAVGNVIESMPRTTLEEASKKQMNSIEWREYMEKLRNL